MITVGSNSQNLPKPLWLLAELTYACPLQCPYCSNPMDFDQYTRQKELSTEEWIRVLCEARQMGAIQLGFSGGEPLVRQDLTTLITEAHQLGYYTNLITSGIGMDAARVAEFRIAGLDHIQVSFQASSEELNNFIAGTQAFEHKLAMAREVKKQGYPMVLCFVLHRENIEQIQDILELAIALEADYVELATAQYYGWAWENRNQLMPTREQLTAAEHIAHEYQAKTQGKMKIYYVVPDYYENRPKACMNGWGAVFLTIAPDGTALPCHEARQLPNLEFPNVREASIDWIWNDSPAFNAFRGDEWMKEPCRSCPEKSKDFGGCRCQAYLLTGDARNADPVCSLSPHHAQVEAVVSAARAVNLGQNEAQPLLFRNPKNAKHLRNT